MQYSINADTDRRYSYPDSGPDRCDGCACNSARNGTADDRPDGHAHTATDPGTDNVPDLGTNACRNGCAYFGTNSGPDDCPDGCAYGRAYRSADRDPDRDTRSGNAGEMVDFVRRIRLRYGRKVDVGSMGGCS